MAAKEGNMRTFLMIAAVAALAVPNARGEEIIQIGDVAATYEYAAQLDHHGDAYGCDPCTLGKRGCSLFGGHGHGCRRAPRSTRNLWENCACNGSYKFPVPPLYTYHWPGLYSQQLMTDYHSPWRFPAIKPYTDEVLPEQVRPASYTAAPAVAAPPRNESLGDKMRRINGQ